MSLLYQNKNFLIIIPNNLKTNYEINYIINNIDNIEQDKTKISNKDYNDKMNKLIKDSFNYANNKLFYDE